MRRFVHSAHVAGLLIGFYVLSLGLLTTLVVVDVTATEQLGVAAWKFLGLCYTATIGLTVIAVRALFVSTRVRKPPGVAVSAAQEPLLWARVHELADIVGTRAPREIRLVPAVNAAVWEDARLLGLIPGKRHLIIGVPLLLGLTRAQLDAVIAHELGHYSGGDTQVGALHGRARATVVSAMVAAQRNSGGFRFAGGAVFAALFTGYAKMVVSVTETASRQQEFAADRVAAQIGGPAAAAAALREIPALDAAFDFYLQRYVTPGLGLSLRPLPHQVLGGFRELLAEPERQRELAEIRARPPKQKVSRYDSHPPLAERIAAIEALAGTVSPDAAMVAAGDAPALTLLVDPDTALAGVAARMLADAPAGTPADWHELARAVAHRRATHTADALRGVAAYQAGRPQRLRDFLDQVDAGGLDAVADALPRPESVRRANAAGRAARALVKVEMKGQVHAWALLELAAVGQVGWRHSWAEAGHELLIADQLRDDLDQAIGALLGATPDTRPLRTVLDRAGVPG